MEVFFAQMHLVPAVAPLSRRAALDLDFFAQRRRKECLENDEVQSRADGKVNSAAKGTRTQRDNAFLGRSRHDASLQRVGRSRDQLGIVPE